MNPISAIFSAELTEALGWMLIHSLWQGAVIATLLFLILSLIKKKSAQIKYFISYVSLIGIMVWGGITFLQSYKYATEKQELRTLMVNNPGYLKTSLSSDNNISENPSTRQTLVINHNTIQFRAFFQRNFNVVCLVWLIGMLFLTARFFGGIIYTRRLRTYQLVPISEEWYQIIKSLSDKLCITRKVEVFFSPLTQVPITMGAIKHIILFPISALTGLSQKEFEAIVAHELAHVMRHDYMFNIIQSIVEILFFYHPAVWLISGQVRAERENSSDNIAVEATGNRIEYIKTLAAMQIKQAEPARLIMAFSGNRGSVLQRIKRLKNEIAMKTNFIEGLIAASVITAGLVLASFTSGVGIDLSLPRNSDSVIQQRQDPNRDSLLEATAKNLDKAQLNQQEADEIEKAIEIAMSEVNLQLSAQMMDEINQCIIDINVNEIVNAAMLEASKAMQEASFEVKEALQEVKEENINDEMRKAAKEIEAARIEMEWEMRRDMTAEGVDPAIIEASVNAAKAGMDIATNVVGNLDVEGIVITALQGVSVALNSLGNIQLDMESNVAENQNKQERKSHTKELEKQKKELIEMQEELEKKLEELERVLEEERE
jgi:bla regulator protein blaR1